MFDVFISYSHEDEALAAALASGLGRIGKPWWRRRSLRVFRDTNVMTASADLWDSIRQPLEASRWFVAVISPAAAASPWVSREMAWWMDHREHDHVLVVLADGTGAWDREVNDWAIDATAVPVPLRRAFAVAPTLIDATWARDVEHLDRRDGRVLNLLAEIAAPVQGTTKDAVVGEELRQRRRTVRTAIGVAALLLVLTLAAVVGAFVALDQRDQAESRRQESLSQGLAAQATDEGRRRPDLGILLAVEAWRHAHTSEAEQALVTAAKQEGQIPRVISRGKPVLAIAYQGLDDVFVVLRADGTIERWREGDESGWTGSGLRDSRFQSLLQLGPRVFGVSRGGTVYELDDSLHEVTGNWSVASGARWSAMGATSDGTVLGVGDQGGQLRMWSVAGRAPIGPAVPAHAGGVAGVAVRGDGRQVVSLGANDNQLKTWTVTPAGLQPLGTFALSALGTSVAYLSDDRTIAVGEGNGSVQLLDADTLTVRSDFGANGSKSLHTAFISQVIPIRDPRTDGGFATVGLDGWIVRLTGSFGVFSSRRAAESTPLAAAINRDTGLTLIASADGTTSVVDRGVSSKFGTFVISQATRVQMGDTATADRAIVIENDTDTDAAVVTLRAVDATGHLERTVAQTASLPGVASAVALGGDALAVVDTSGVVRRYERGRETAVLRFDVVGNTSRPSLVALRRDRLGLVIGSSVAIIDTSDGELRKARIVNDRNGARFSAVAAFPDGGKLAASMGDGSLVVVDVETGKDVARTMTNARSSGLAIAPDGRLMAQVDGLTGVVSIRDATTLQPVGRALAAPGFVNNLTWLDDGRRLATASTDGSVHYWDIATRKQLAELPHGSVVDNVFAAPQGSVVYSVGDGDLREWDLDPQRAVRAACTEAGRNLTRDEWETYLGSEPYRLTCPRPN